MEFFNDIISTFKRNSEGDYIPAGGFKVFSHERELFDLLLFFNYNISSFLELVLLAEIKIVQQVKISLIVNRNILNKHKNQIHPLLAPQWIYIIIWLSGL